MVTLREDQMQDDKNLAESVETEEERRGHLRVHNGANEGKG